MHKNYNRPETQSCCLIRQKQVALEFYEKTGKEEHSPLTGEISKQHPGSMCQRTGNSP